MDKQEFETNLLARLEAALGEIEIDVQRMEQDGVVILRSAYEFGQGVGVLLDMLFTTSDQARPILQLYFYVTNGMGSTKRAELLEYLRTLNFDAPLGSFGVFDAADQLYYKQGILFPLGVDMEAACDQVLDHLEIMLVYLRHHYPALMELCE